MTLYTWAGDAPGISMCTDSCVGPWPPLLAPDGLVAPSDLPGVLGSIVRDDGTTQVTYNDAPLYTFGGDTSPGDTNGQGSNGFGAAWSVVVVLPPATSATIPVAIVNFEFQPAAVSVKVGDTVGWANKGSAPHTSTSDTGVWDTGSISPSQGGSFTFTTAGTFAYHCNIHPSMHGTITVQ